MTKTLNDRIELNDQIDLLRDTKARALESLELAEGSRAAYTARNDILADEFAAIAAASAVRREILDEDEKDIKDPEFRARYKAALTAVDEAREAMWARQKLPDYVAADERCQILQNHESAKAGNQGLIRTIDERLPVLLFAAGRAEESLSLYPGRTLVEHEDTTYGPIDRDDLALFGPDEQVWVTRGSNGDRFLSLKPAPEGDLWVLVELSTRYYELKAWVGPQEYLKEIMSHSRLSPWDFPEPDVFDNRRDEFLLPVGPLPEGSFEGELNIDVVYRAVNARMFELGYMGDGFIRFDEGAPEIVRLGRPGALRSTAAELEGWVDEVIEANRLLDAGGL